MRHSTIRGWALNGKIMEIPKFPMSWECLADRSILMDIYELSYPG